MPKPIMHLSSKATLLLASLILAPWIVVAAIYFRSGPAPAGPEAAEAAAAAAAPASTITGPWGTLQTNTIVISPPIEYVAVEEGSAAPPRWFFPGVAPERAEALLAAAGMDPQAAAAVRATARPIPGNAGTVLMPNPDVVRGLPAEVRARLYRMLAASPANRSQAQSFRFHGTSVDAWLRGSLISDTTRQLIEPLIYRDDGWLHFADMELVESQIKDDEEIRRLYKTLSRQSTVLARLVVNNAADVGLLAAYWGLGGRRTDLRPLLESVAASGDRTIDVTHLLPAFARNHLYRYFRVSAADLDRPVIANCLWTSLNFFEDKPDDRFLDVAHAMNVLKTDYHVIEAGFQLGDIIVFLDAGNNLFHAAVYIAGDLVLTKNGTSPMSPWLLLPLDQVKGYYRSRAAEPLLLYHRRNGL